jgi:hypothetical protein
MTIDLFYPAPQGRPVPVNPPRGDDGIYRLLSGTDWGQVLHLESDHLIRAGALWLYGFLDEAHRLTQQDPSSEGAYWHALVHRSEGDFSNALYWFRRAGDHPVQARLKARVREAMKERGLDGWQTLVESPRWEPARLVELCERSFRGEPAHPVVLQEVVRMEYNLLMEYVLDQARS